MATKKRRRKKNRYQTGVHISPKCATPIHYRSGWEKVVCLYLDDDPTVASYEYEVLKLPYINNIRYQKTRWYFPDFLVHYTDGRTVLAEVKREDKLTDPKIMKKAEAGRTWARNNKAEYQFWTDSMILPLQRAYKLKAMLPVKPKKPRKKRKKVVSSTSA